MRRLEAATDVAQVALTLGGCATSNEAKPAQPPPAGGGDLASQPMTYGTGDGTSCAQAVVIHAKDEFSGVRAEYVWIAARYPGYEKKMQALTNCNGRPADEIGIRTADGQEVKVYFDISEYFGHM